MPPKFDESRLTAFALGEPLPPEELRQMERLLASSADARAEVAEVRALELDLRGAYRAERQTASADRDMDRIVEFSRPRSIPPRVPWRTHLRRIAAMVALSGGVLALGLFYWAGVSRTPIQTRASTVPTPTDPSERMEFVLGESPARADAMNLSGYALVRRAIRDGRLPSREAVDVRGLVNHFQYGGPAVPADSEYPVAVQLEAATAPWQPRNRLVRVHWKSTRDTSAEVNFNPALVAAYRRVGVDREDREFDSERLHARAGMASTELFEVVPAGADAATMEGLDDTWRRTAPPGRADQNLVDLLIVTFEAPAAGNVPSATRAFRLRDEGKPFAAASPDFQFAAAVAGFGLLLRDAPGRGNISPDLVAAWAGAALGDEQAPERSEFIQLVNAAGALLNAKGTGSS